MKRIEVALGSLKNNNLRDGLRTSLVKIVDFNGFSHFTPRLGDVLGKPDAFRFDSFTTPSSVFTALNTDVPLPVCETVYQYIYELNGCINEIIATRNFKWSLRILRDNVKHTEFENGILEIINTEDILEEKIIVRINDILDKLKEER